jgi:hypothetical protein
MIKRGNKRPGFSKKQHFWMGDELGKLDRELWQVFSEVQRAYGKTAPQTRYLRRAYELLVKARSALNDAVCRELPLDDDALKAYYRRYQLVPPEDRPIDTPIT